MSKVNKENDEDSSDSFIQTQLNGELNDNVFMIHTQVAKEENSDGESDVQSVCDDFLDGDTSLVPNLCISQTQGSVYDEPFIISTKDDQFDSSVKLDGSGMLLQNVKLSSTIIQNDKNIDENRKFSFGEINEER